MGSKNPQSIDQMGENKAIPFCAAQPLIILDC
jgi:hypothetical protein